MNHGRVRQDRVSSLSCIVTLPEAGVTLIELLVAVSLMALLSTGMAIVLRVGLDGSKKAQDRIASNRKVIGVERVMREQLANLMPVAMNCATSDAPQSNAQPLFEGRPGAMRFVSTYSLNEAARGVPRMMEYLVIPSDQGGFRLVMNEVLYGGPMWLFRVCTGMSSTSDGVTVPSFAPIRATANSFILADDLASCQFSYRENRPPPDYERWTNGWELPKWPAAIRIQLVPLHPNPAVLQPTSLTVPLLVNMKPGQAYHD